MLLQRLADYANRDPDARPFHRRLGFRWELALTADGTPLRDSLDEITVQENTKKPRLSEHVVPATVRTVGVAANLAADDAQYVLGWGDETTKPDRVAQCHASFTDLTRRWAQAHPDEQAATALAAFYAADGPGTLTRPEGLTAKDRVLVTVAGDRAYGSPSAAGFWAGEVARRKGGAAAGVCLVCGQHRPLLDTVPSKVPSKLVPGASNDAALVSVNQRVFGYGLSEQLACTPICLSCGEAMSNGLVAVLSSPRTTTYDGQDSVLAWWQTDDTQPDYMNLVFDGDPTAVGDFIRQARQGHRDAALHNAASTDLSRFCALGVGGNIARVMVRDWIDLPLPELHQRVLSWFDDHEITPLGADEPRWQPLKRLVTAAGRWQRKERRYAFIGAKGADRPNDLHRHLLRALLRGAALPPSLLGHLVNRVRTDGRLDTPRAALLRLLLVRSRTYAENKKPMPSLDTSERDPSYVAGRVFATYESLQYKALGRDLNTTFTDRFFQGAVGNPLPALVQGGKDAKAWLKKLRRTESGKAAAAAFEKNLNELFEIFALSSMPPARCSVGQQARFLLGYYHQRAHNIAAARDRKNQNDEETTA